MNNFELLISLESCEHSIAKANAEIKALKKSLPYADGPAYTQDKQRIGQLNADLIRFAKEKESIWVSLDKELRKQVESKQLYIFLCLESLSIGGVHAYTSMPSDEHLADMSLKHIATVNLKDIGVTFENIHFQKERDEAITRRADFKKAELQAQIDALDSAA